MLQDINQTILLKDHKLVISTASVDDAVQLVSFLNVVGGETDYLTFGLNQFHLSSTEEAEFIANGLQHKQSLMLVGKINTEIVAQLYLDRSNQPRILHIGDISISVKKNTGGNQLLHI